MQALNLNPAKTCERVNVCTHVCGSEVPPMCNGLHIDRLETHKDKYYKPFSIINSPIIVYSNGQSQCTPHITDLHHSCHYKH